MSDIDSLLRYASAITPDTTQRDAHIVTFLADDAVTTMRIGLNDYSGADLVITNMTTLPDKVKSRGYGSKALRSLLEWAAEQNLTEILAVQVQEQSEQFWIKNKFTKCPDPNPCNDFKYQGPSE